MKGGDLHLSQPLHAVDQMHREPDPKLEADAEARIEAAVEAERERARQREQLLAFELKLVGDRVQRQTGEIRKLIDIERRREALETDQLAEIRAVKAGVADLTEIARDLRGLFASAVDALQELVAMKTNGHAH